MTNAKRMPTLYLPHGGGPCFFMDWTMGPADTWEKMGNWLRTVSLSLPEKPKALVVISAHWEEQVVTINRHPSPPLLFDYFGFPKHTYELKYDATGSPELAQKIASLLLSQNIATRFDEERGFDHGVFVPLKLVFPDADIPIVQVSLKAGLNPSEHIEIGKALQSLRDEGVLLIGSGMSYHNLNSFFRGGEASQNSSRLFDDWLSVAATQSDWQIRNLQLSSWSEAPGAKDAHPREEHLIPLMVAAGAAGQDGGEQIFHDIVMGAHISGYKFG